MVELIAELATSHGGDVDLACDMVLAAADAGAHTVKIQSYQASSLNRADPQYVWLSQSALDREGHERIMKACEQAGVQELSTPFDRESLFMLKDMCFGRGRVKVASSQQIWHVSEQALLFFVKSWEWGRKPGSWLGHVDKHLTAIPLYPTPLEAVSAAPLLDGWSDHTVGTAVCKHMLSRGAKMIEAHFCLPGRSRQMPFDKTPEQFREIRDWADTVETLTTGVSQVFRERWRK